MAGFGIPKSGKDTMVDFWRLFASGRAANPVRDRGWGKNVFFRLRNPDFSKNPKIPFFEKSGDFSDRSGVAKNGR